MGSIRDLKNAGLQKTFAAGQGRKRKERDIAQFGFQDEDKLNCTGRALVRVFVNLLKEHSISADTIEAAVEHLFLSIEGEMDAEVFEDAQQYIGSKEFSAYIREEA
jgi:hypothetical protein